MRIISTLLFIGINSAFGQVIDEFDGNALHSEWYGDRDKFKLENGDLISNSEISGDEFSISRSCETLDTLEFRLSCHLDFPTSSVNYVELILDGDSGSILYKFGGTRDQITLSFNDSDRLVIPGANTERSHWDLQLILAKGTVSFNFIETKNWWAFDSSLSMFSNSIFPSRFTIQIKQSTSSFFGKHSYDDLYIGPRIRDTIAPSIDSLIFLNHHTIHLTLSEPADTAITPQCNLSGANVRVDFKSTTKLELSTEEAIVDDRRYELQISGLFDLEGNESDTGLHFMPRVPIRPQKGDVLIMELMTDPDPSISLPPVEYVELTNLRKYYLDLSKCRMLDKGSSEEIGPLILPPLRSIILCDAKDTALFSKIVLVHGMDRIPSLNNTTDRIRIVDQDDQILDEIEYDRDNVEPEWKREGGWSMVMLDSTKRCLGLQNWAYSEDPGGGDPGLFDQKARMAYEFGSLGIKQMDMLSPRSLRLTFSSPLLDYRDCFIRESLRELDNPEVKMSGKQLSVAMASPMSPGSVYTLHLVGAKDCIARALDTTVLFGIPSDILPGEIVINEVLFNPLTGGSDFVELRNNSSELKDISQLFFFDLDSSGMKNHWQAAVPNFQTIAPGKCIALNEDPAFLKEQYFPSHEAILTYSDAIPSLPNDSGFIGIANRQGQVIDEFHYSEDMHALLLPEPDGCSIERIDPYQATDLFRNWTSASSHVNYATPGYENSQYRSAVFDDGLLITPKSLDLRYGLHSTQINIRHDLGNVSMHVFVFNEQGMVVKRIADGLLTGNESSWYWDGSTETGLPAPTGTYLITAHCLSVNGDRDRWKGVIHLIR